MSGIFPTIRCSSFIIIFLMTAVLVLSGCRWLSSKSSTSATPVSPIVNTPPPVTAPTPPPPTGEPDRYEAFRPIISAPFSPSAPPAVQTMPVQPVPEREIKSEPKKIDPQPDVAAQVKIDELNKKITDLESQLAEAKKQQTDTEVFPETVETLPKKENEVQKIEKLPIINKQGVTVSSDELRRIRIEVMDKVLFMPNAWQLTAEGEETLRTIAAEIRAFDVEADLDIEGHTDSLMTDPRNPVQKHDISSDKAKVVMDFFVNTLRWDIARIGTSSLGSKRPVADNGTPEGRDRNNRVEIVLRNRSK